jgi:hypothetical protein
MRNIYNISNEVVQSENGTVYNIDDLNDVDISGIKNIISSLDFKVLEEENNTKQTYFINPDGIITNFSGLLQTSKILKTSVITFSELIQSQNDTYQLKFTFHPPPQINEQIIITIERPDKLTMQFSAKVVEIYGNDFTIEEKRFTSELVQDIQDGNHITFKISQNEDSFLIDYNQLFILGLVAIKNLSNRIDQL